MPVLKIATPPRNVAGGTAGVAFAVILAMSVSIGTGLIFQIGRLQEELHEMQLSPQPNGKTLGIEGVDQRGRIVEGLPSGARKIVAFALKGSTLATEIAFWRKVRESAPVGTAFVGMCADRKCVALAPQLDTDLRILVAGEAGGLSEVLRAGRAGDFLVTDDHARILAAPRLRGYGPGGVLAEIGRAR